MLILKKNWLINETMEQIKKEIYFINFSDTKFKRTSTAEQP